VAHRFGTRAQGPGIPTLPDSAQRYAHAAIAAIRHFGLLSLVGFVPWLMVAIVLGQIVVWLSPASHNQALGAGLLLSLIITPILLRPVGRFVRLNMTDWRTETIDSPWSLRFRYVTLLIGLGILPWLVGRFAVETAIAGFTTIPAGTRFWISAIFATWFAWALMMRAAPTVKRFLYPELLPEGSGAAPEIANGGPAIDRGLVDLAYFGHGGTDVLGREIPRKLESVDAHAREEGYLVTQEMSADPDLAAVAEPRSQ
jgi:hypothetical protein